MKFIDIPADERKRILDSLQTRLGLRAAVIEKDWWVTEVLRALFQLPYAGHLSFKGGTNLSKCWHLIERMSEDADIGIDREFLGFSGTLSKNQISDKLRRAACSFVRNTLQNDLRGQMEVNGINPDVFCVHVDITPVSTTDPEVIQVDYAQVSESAPYIKPSVKIEVSGRSMTEPVESVEINSMIDGALPGAVFNEKPFDVRAVLPKRTFLEKIFLLHEEFSKEGGLIRVDRMSRHLYDVYKMLATPIADEALADDELYESVINHRRIFIGLKGFNYDTLHKSTLDIIPPESVYQAWKRDYETMQHEMIYGLSPDFDEMIAKLRAFNIRIADSAK